MSKRYTPFNILDPNGHPIVTETGQWKMRASKAGGTTIRYLGYTRPNTSESDAGWMISEQVYDAEGDMVEKNFAGGKATFENVWDSGSFATVSGVTQANPAVVTANNHGFEDGSIVYFAEVAGMTELNDEFYQVASATTNTFALQDLDGNNVNSTGFTAYSSGGKAYKPEYANYTFA